MSDRDPLPPVGPELAWRNRQLLAARLHWPAGALEACEACELDHPDWHPNYSPGNTVPGFESPAGFYAMRRRSQRGEGPAYGVDPHALRKAIEARRSG